MLYITLIAISFLFFSSASANEFIFESPSEVVLGQPFNVSIDSNTEINYDVKIFVHEHTKEFSEIFYENTWRSPFSYINGAYPLNKKFQLRSHHLGESLIYLRLRESGTSGFDIELINSIKTIESPNIYEDNLPEATQSLNSQYFSDENPPKQNTEPIFLNSLNETGHPEIVSIVTREEKTRITMLLAFTITTIIIIILISLRKL